MARALLELAHKPDEYIGIDPIMVRQCLRFMGPR